MYFPTSFKPVVIDRHRRRTGASMHAFARAFYSMTLSEMRARLSRCRSATSRRTREPNATATDPQYEDPTWKLGQVIVDRYDSTVDHDDFNQPGNLFRMFDDDHRDPLATRIAGVLGQARKEVQMRPLCHFFRADEDYGRPVAAQLRIDVDAFMEEANNALQPA